MSENTLTVDLSKAVAIGENIKAVKTTDGQLVLVIDMAHRGVMKEGGKLTPIASSGGFQPLGAGVKLNLYLGTK